MAETLEVGSSLAITEYFPLISKNSVNGNLFEVSGAEVRIWGSINATESGNTVTVSANLFCQWTRSDGSAGQISGCGAAMALEVDDSTYIKRDSALFFGENGNSSDANTTYSKTISITLDKQAHETETTVEFSYGPAYDGEILYGDGIYGQNSVQINLTIPKAQFKLTLIKGNGVESFTCSDANSQNGNIYTFDYGDKASTYTVASTGYVLSSHSGTNANGVGESTWTGCNGKTEYSIPDDWEMTADRTITANAIPITYTINYNGNGATSGATSASTHTYNAAKTLTANGFMRTGYSFRCWNTNANGTGTSYTDKDSVTNLASTNNATVTLYAQWTPITYTIKYDGNGNTSGSTASSTHTYNVAKNLTSNGFARTGFTFGGWNTEADGTGTSYTNTVSVKNLSSTSQTITLYAVWQPNQLNIYYHSSGAEQFVNGELEDGVDIILNSDAPHVITATDTEYHITPPNDSDGGFWFERIGYKLIHGNGWAIDGGGFVFPEDLESSSNYVSVCEALYADVNNSSCDVHLYVEWEPIIVSVLLMVDDEFFETYYFHYARYITHEDGRISYFYKNSELTDPVYSGEQIPVPIKTGYSFKGFLIVDPDVGDVWISEGGFLNEGLTTDWGDTAIVATAIFEPLSTIYADTDNGFKPGITYVRMTDGTYKQGIAVYVKNEYGEWKISTR